MNPRIPLYKLFFGKLSLVPIIIDDGIESLNLDDYPYIEEYSLNYNFANKRIINHFHQNGKK